ncbi:MAG: ATP-dependent DNA ligase [Desulfobacterales bacterium]|nr:ATP-dependent DNA ligase [Desulfobacterales bacterium]
MKRFAALYAALDRTTGTAEKVRALADYFAAAPAADAAWALSFLIGRRPRRPVPTARLKRWAAEAAGIPEWLFAACYETVGDLAETITHLLPPERVEAGPLRPLSAWIEETLLPLRGLPEERQREAVLAAWRAMDSAERLAWNKLITGGFRVGVSQRLVVRALAARLGVEAAAVAQRLMGAWTPGEAFWERLGAACTDDADASRPYPFCLAHPLEEGPEALGPAAEWLAEWKWDGIRAQLVRRGGRVFVWSRGEELVTEKFPEIAAAAAGLPDGCVLDGEILAWREGRPLDFARLQQRIGRKDLTAKVLAEAPAVFMAYDLLESDGRELRAQALSERRAALAALLSAAGGPVLLLSPQLSAPDWPALAALREQARGRGVEGLMVKRLFSAYGVGRRRGDWWKWKLAPLAVDAVLVYAQPGRGRRATLYTDYTFAVRDGEALVPFAKAYSGLTDAEIRDVDRFVRANTTERFGPVRAVKPELVFEIAFEAIRPSPRHKSGVAVRFPRIARRRPDKRPAEADTLATLKSLLHAPAPPPAAS